MVDYPIHIDTVNIGMSIVQLKGPQVEFSKAQHRFQKTLYKGSHDRFEFII